MVKSIDPELQEKIDDSQQEIMKKDLSDIVDKDKKLDDKLKNLKRKMMNKYSTEQVELLNEHSILQMNKKLGRVSKI